MGGIPEGAAEIIEKAARAEAWNAANTNHGYKDDSGRDLEEFWKHRQSMKNKFMSETLTSDTAMCAFYTAYVVANQGYGKKLSDPGVKDVLRKCIETCDKL